MPDFVPQTVREAVDTFRADRAHLEARGLIFPQAVSYLAEDARRDYRIAMDGATGPLFTTPNAAVPGFLTQMIDPTIIRILFAPTKAAEILGEEKKGDWLLDTAYFPVVEHVGEVSSYGDFNENGNAGVNTNWPGRQNYLFQTIEEYGDREVERAGLARLNWVAEMDAAAADIMNRFLNLTYFFGVGGLQNYGLLNDANLGASLTPALKAYGGVKWILNGVVVATANEVYNDILSLYLQLVTQTAGLVDAQTPMILALAPQVELALHATNSFNVNVFDLLKKNFPNIKIITAVQYGVVSASNPQGIAAGNFIQLIATAIQGQNTGRAAFSEKMRAHPPVRGVSSFKKKVTGGSWGTIIRVPIGVASMVGV